MLALRLNRAYKRAMTARLDGSDPEADVPDGGRTQQLFTMAMFALLGRIAKLDGRVSSEEVTYATSIMKLMDLSSAQRRQAINYFDQGKQPNADVLGCVQDLVKTIGVRSALPTRP